MTNKKSTKRALLLSALSMLLCVSMLVGSTFAWFTDSVESGVNKIEAGNLDIELYHGKVAEPTVNKVKGATDIFTDKGNAAIVWEPGVVAWTNLNVVNEGSLALKYQLAINFTNENYIEENGAKLSEVLKVAFLENPVTETEREKVLELAKDKGVFLKDLMMSGSLQKKGTEEDNKVYGVVIYWEPSANDNKWNVYNGRTTSDGKLLHIDLGITLVATQKDAEFDSFGNDYDKDAIKNGIRIEKDGLELIYTENGAVILNKVLPEFVGDTLVVPEGVTSIGYGTLASTAGNGTQVFTSAPQVKKVVFASTVNNIGYQAFKDSAVEEVVINEGLTEIDAYAFNGAKKLAKFNIPSTVTTIEERAFRLTAATEVTVPATVQRVEEAFRDMPNLTKLVFEGNTVISPYLTRSCANLAEVHLLGDDVTFTATSTGGNSGMAFVNADSGKAENITIYVKNTVVADRVVTAQGGAYGYKLSINGIEYVTKKVGNLTQLQKELNEATTGTFITLTADITGGATVSQKAGVDLVINGNGKTYTGSILINGNNRSTGTESVIIANMNFVSDEKVDFVSAPNTIDGVKNRYSHNITVTDCTFSAPTYNESVVGVQANSSYNLKVLNCTATNMHSLMQAESCGATVTVDGCKTINCKSGVSFNNTKTAVIKNSVIESVADGGYGVRVKAEQANYSLSIENCTISAFVPVLVRNAKANVYNVTVSGVNTMTANNTFGYQVVVANADWDDDSVAPAAPTGNITLTGLDSFNVFKG